MISLCITLYYPANWLQEL